MTNKIFSLLKVVTLAIVLSFGLSYVYAWTAPTATPPTGNVLAPLNTSGTAQIKTGALTTAGLTTTNRLTVGEAGGAYTYITMQDDESPVSKVKYIHANSNVIGFLGSTGNWLTYFTNDGDSVLVRNAYAGDYYSSSVGKWMSTVANEATHGKQKFTSNGTFTVPAGVTKVWVSMSGGGGGGRWKLFNRWL